MHNKTVQLVNGYPLLFEAGRRIFDLQIVVENGYLMQIGKMNYAVT